MKCEKRTDQHDTSVGQRQPSPSVQEVMGSISRSCHTYLDLKNGQSLIFL